MRIVTRKPSFQGDLMVRRIDIVPGGLKEVYPENGVHILAHSESGHHHVIDACAATWFINEMNSFISFLEVTNSTEIRHLREFDTHESLTLAPGIYEIRTQREYVPDGWRRAAD
jgi:hypothetical protein